MADKELRVIFEILYYIFLLCILSLALFIGNQLGRNEMKKEMQQKAIKHNVAEYVIVDKKTGKTEFKWRE